jgi:DNA-binding MarR family transcriptional regulator
MRIVSDMADPSSDHRSAAQSSGGVGMLSGPSVDSEITWLLHRAAQRMHVATGDVAERHGLQLRDHIVLSALRMTSNLTQSQLGKALGLDKTTLTGQLDRLEDLGLIVRGSSPADRRARIPQITDEGEALQARVSEAASAIETSTLAAFDHDEVATFRRMLVAIIGDAQDPGSCL